MSEFRDDKNEKVSTMKRNNKVFVIGVSLALALFALDSCKSSTVTEPSPVGPSSTAVILSLTASPNAMFAGQFVRETSAITATLKKFDGIPLAGANILFTIESARGSLGYFEDEMNSLSAATDAEGAVHLTYYGPLFGELSRSMDVLIKAEVAWEGAQAIWGSTPIHIVHGEE
jgi:hypothetical protein